MCKTPTRCTMPHHSASSKLYASSSTLRKDLTSTHSEGVFMLLRFMLLYTETTSMSSGYFWKAEQNRTFRMISMNLRCIGHARIVMRRCRPFWGNMGRHLMNPAGTMFFGNLDRVPGADRISGVEWMD